MDSDPKIEVWFEESQEGENEKGTVKPWNQIHGTIFELNKRVLHESKASERDALAAIYDLEFKK